MTADEQVAAARELQVLREQGFTLELAGDGYLYPTGPRPLDSVIVDRLEDFLRGLAQPDPDAPIN